MTDAEVAQWLQNQEFKGDENNKYNIAEKKPEPKPMMPPPVFEKKDSTLWAGKIQEEEKDDEGFYVQEDDGWGGGGGDDPWGFGGGNDGWGSEVIGEGVPDMEKSPSLKKKVSCLVK